VKEIVLKLPNKPGQVHQVSELLGSHGINIRAVAVIANGSSADLHLLLSKPDEGEKILRDKGHDLMTGEVLLLELHHSPGELARLTKLIADAGVNITLLYGSGSNSPEAQLVVGVDDIPKAKDALGME
jgi:hypothetical protein